jgi:crotonobetainyl-CoA:carnitine CoA-transferase CaiB-like acyl-CoA transferase
LSAPPPVQGLRVLDLADDSGAMCGRILADLGADVVKVEPPAGDPGRRVPPFAHDRPDIDRSLSWLAANVGKRGITCNLSSESGRSLFLRLVERADVLVTTARWLGSGLQYDDLAAVNSRLIYAALRPYGNHGPLEERPASDLEVTASSGALGLAGDPDGVPVRTSVPMAPAWTGMYGACGVLLAMLARDQTGRGQFIDLSGQHSLLTAISHAPVFWDLLGEEQSRSGPFLVGRSVTGVQFRNIWPCRDGYVTFALYGGAAGRATARALVAWMDERGAAPDVVKQIDWDQFDVATASPELVATIEDAIGPFFLQLTKDEFFRGVGERNMLGYPVATVEDIDRDEQLAARGFWQTISSPWSKGQIPFPGGFALFDGQRLAVTRSAPRLGEHNLEVYRDELGLSADEVTALRSAGVV